MDSASYRQQLRVAEICRASGDTAGCERALHAFLDGVVPNADGHYALGNGEVYTEVANGFVELIRLSRKRDDLPGARVAAAKATAFFMGRGDRLARVARGLRGDLFATVADNVPGSAMKAQLFSAAAREYGEANKLARAADCLLGQVAALKHERRYHQAHEAALGARELAQQADDTVLETYAVFEISELFRIAGDNAAAQGVIAQFLDRSYNPKANDDVLRARAQLTETLMRRFEETKNYHAAGVARKDAAELFRSIGEFGEAARLQGRM